MRLAAEVAVERGQTGQIVVSGQDVRLFGSVRRVDAASAERASIPSP